MFLSGGWWKNTAETKTALCRRKFSIAPLSLKSESPESLLIVDTKGVGGHPLKQQMGGENYYHPSNFPSSVASTARGKQTSAATRPFFANAWLCFSRGRTRTCRRRDKYYFKRNFKVCCASANLYFMGGGGRNNITISLVQCMHNRLLFSLCIW